MRYFYFISVLVFISSCGSPKETSSTGQHINMDSVRENNIEKKTPATVLLTGESEYIRQQLEITFLDSLHISYKIIASSKSVDCRQTLSGTATRKSGIDSEIDEDDEGNMYPADEYWDDKTDGFSIRVNIIDSKWAKIRYPLPSDSAEACSRLVEEIPLKRIYDK